jgi:hypothetical protein
MGKAYIKTKKAGGWFEVYVVEDRCIGCHRAFAGHFKLRHARLDPNLFDNVTCPRCGTRNYAAIQAQA